MQENKIKKEPAWLTIFTPTKNRPHSLQNLATCLSNQTVKTGWRWVVWHDGLDGDSNYQPTINSLPFDLPLTYKNTGVGDLAKPGYDQHREYPIRQCFTKDWLDTEWVCYCDDDDLLPNDFIEKLQPHHQNAELIQWRMAMLHWMRDASKSSLTWLKPGKFTSKDFEGASFLTLVETGYGIGEVGMGSFAIRSAISKEINFPIWNGTGDQAHFIGCRALAETKIHLPEVLYVYT